MTNACPHLICTGGRSSSHDRTAVKQHLPLSRLHVTENVFPHTHPGPPSHSRNPPPNKYQQVYFSTRRGQQRAEPSSTASIARPSRMLSYSGACPLQLTLRYNRTFPSPAHTPYPCVTNSGSRAKLDRYLNNNSGHHITTRVHKCTAALPKPRPTDPPPARHHPNCRRPFSNLQKKQQKRHRIKKKAKSSATEICPHAVPAAASPRVRPHPLRYAQGYERSLRHEAVGRGRPSSAGSDSPAMHARARTHERRQSREAGGGVGRYTQETE